jgi:hypothetical protein
MQGEGRPCDFARPVRAFLAPMIVTPNDQALRRSQNNQTVTPTTITAQTGRMTFVY